MLLSWLLSIIGAFAGAWAGVGANSADVSPIITGGLGWLIGFSLGLFLHSLNRKNAGR